MRGKRVSKYLLRFLRDICIPLHCHESSPKIKFEINIRINSQMKCLRNVEGQQTKKEFFLEKENPLRNTPSFYIGIAKTARTTSTWKTQKS